MLKGRNLISPADFTNDELMEIMELARKVMEDPSKYAKACEEEGYMICSKKGKVEKMSVCRKFSYDPCKRIPAKAKALDFEKYKEQDYSL